MHAATSVDQCVCEAGFQQSVAADGSAVCECGPGFEIVNGVRCRPCRNGRWKAAVGNFKCTDCQNEHTTTASVGAYSDALCVCEMGTFAREVSPLALQR